MIVVEVHQNTGATVNGVVGVVGAVGEVAVDGDVVVAGDGVAVVVQGIAIAIHIVVVVVVIDLIRLMLCDERVEGVGVDAGPTSLGQQ
mgnify:CR=1 FL=1